MNDPWTTVAWSSVQVTLVALAGLVMERVASRRGPRAASWVAAASLSLIALVTPLAFCPVPQGWIWHRERPLARSIAISEHRPSRDPASASKLDGNSSGARNRDSESIRSGDFWSSLLAVRLRAVWAWGEFPMPVTHLAWMRAWGMVLSLGAIFGLCRLVVGLWGVSHCRRHSVPVNDPDILALLNTLRCAMGCRRRIEVRERPEWTASTAAAVGWWKPLILLPHGWRQWHGDDLKAVLAHEVAHIASGDYAAGVVAQFGLALHFYHPLVHWIVTRLFLHQELAADAQGARLSGGSRIYLLALSRLALRLEESWWALPAKMFLPARGQLVRRIQMLKAIMPQKNLSVSPIGRAITIAMLCAVGLAAASLRGPTASLADEKPLASETAKSPLAASAKTTNADVATSAPFDLSLLPGHDMAFLAARPAAIFRIPGMRRYAEMLDAEIAGLLKRNGGAGVGFNVESIEQAVIGLNILPRDPKNKQPGRIMTGAVVLKSVHERDWLPLVKSVLKAIDPKCSEMAPVEFERRVYYTSACPPLGAHGSVYFPDRRTLVFATEEQIRAMIKQPASHWAVFATGDDWNKASGGLYAIAINNVDHRCKFDLNPETPDEIKFERMVATSSRVVFGLGWGEMLGLKAIATYDTDGAATYAATVLPELLSKASPALHELEASARSSKRKEAEEYYRVVRAILGACVVRQSGRTVEIQGRKKLSASEVAAIGMALVGG